MLNIIFGRIENVYYGPAWFVNNYEQSWLEDELSKKMIKDVDKSEYRGGELIYSNLLGPISPRDLSGGVKTLISIYMESGLIFDATSCGENCAKWLIEIGRKKDITINLKYLMQFDGCEPFKIFIVNNQKTVETEYDYLSNALEILHDER